MVWQPTKAEITTNANIAAQTSALRLRRQPERENGEVRGPIAFTVDFLLLGTRISDALDFSASLALPQEGAVANQLVAILSFYMRHINTTIVLTNSVPTRPTCLPQSKQSNPTIYSLTPSGIRIQIDSSCSLVWIVVQEGDALPDIEHSQFRTCCL